MKRKAVVHLRYVVLAAVSVMVLACATGAKNVQITKENKASVNSVAIDKNVLLPEEPYIQGSNSRIAYLLAGGAGVAAEGKSAAQAFKSYMEENNIDLAKIVVASFEENILKDNIFTLRDDSSYKLNLKVNVFGYAESRFLGLVTPEVYRKPLMNITATMVDTNGNIIWQKTDYITSNSDKVTEYTFEELAENPSKTTESLSEIAALVASEVMDDFRNN